MKEIDILKKAISRKHPCDQCHAALKRIETLIKQAPKFFSHHDFDGEKTDWLKRAELLE